MKYYFFFQNDLINWNKWSLIGDLFANIEIYSDVPFRIHEHHGSIISSLTFCGVLLAGRRQKKPLARAPVPDCLCLWRVAVLHKTIFPIYWKFRAKMWNHWHIAESCSGMSFLPWPPGKHALQHSLCLSLCCLSERAKLLMLILPGLTKICILVGPHRYLSAMGTAVYEGERAKSKFRQYKSRYRLRLDWWVWSSDAVKNVPELKTLI